MHSDRIEEFPFLFILNKWRYNKEVYFYSSNPWITKKLATIKLQLQCQESDKRKKKKMKEKQNEKRTINTSWWEVSQSHDALKEITNISLGIPHSSQQQSYTKYIKEYKKNIFIEKARNLCRNGKIFII